MKIKTLQLASSGLLLVLICTAVFASTATTRRFLVGTWKPVTGQKSTVLKMVFLPNGGCYMDVKDAAEVEQWKGDYKVINHNTVDMNFYTGGGTSSTGQRHPGVVKVSISRGHMTIKGKRSVSKWVRVPKPARNQK